MSYGKFLVGAVVAVTLFGFLPSEGRAETEIHLKDGRVMKVDSFWREEGMVKYESPAGIVGISLDDVAQIITPDMVAFEETHEADTIAAYQRFVKTFPKSGFVEQAKGRIVELQFDEVRSIGTAQVYLDYAERNPNSPFVHEARGQAEALVYAEAAREPTADKYAEYLRLFPEGRHAPEAAVALEKIEFGAAKNSGDVRAMEAFLAKYPETSYREDIMGTMADLQAAARARTQQKAEQDRRRRELEAAQQKESLKLWLGVGAGLLGLALAGAGVLFFLRRRAAVEPDIIDDEVEDFLGAGAGENVSLSDYGPGRYEDIIGVDRKAENPELPDSPPAGPKVDEPAALPTPEWAEKKSAEPSDSEDSAFRKAAATLRTDSSPDPIVHETETPPAGGTPSPDPEVPEEVIDLSDGDTDFKVELEDIPEAPQREPRGRSADEEETVDLSDGDFPDLLADEETIRRRGGKV